MPKQIEILIQPNGEIQIEAVGFKGGACEKATAAIEQALGVAGKRQKKPEYYAAAAAGQQQGT